MKLLITTLSLILTAQVSTAATIDVTFATEGAFMPWNFCLDANGDANNSCTQADVDAGQTLTGFDKDYGDALCAKMSELDMGNDYNCTWVLKPWSDLSMGLTLGTSYDLIIAQMTDTEARRAFADFVGPYMFAPEVKYISLSATSVTMGGATKVTPRTGAGGVTLLDCPTDTSLKIGTQVSTTHSAHVEGLCLNPLTTYATQAEVDAALLNGDIDLMINLTSSASSLLEGPSPVATAHGDSLVYPGARAPSIALDNHNLFADSLKPIVSNAVNALFAVGTTQALQDMWQ